MATVPHKMGSWIRENVGLLRCWIIEVLDYLGVGLLRCWIIEVSLYRENSSTNVH